ncbi:MAG: hypothetical protein ABI355_11230 [Solirubrobacteraceae bacterium]
MPFRRVSLLLIVLLVTLAGFGAQALARRGVSGTEKRTIMTAAGVKTQAPLSCYRVYVSTVGSRWAVTTYGGSSTKPCIAYAADGVSVTHLVHGRWRFLTAGSAFNCPIPGHIPAGVRRDLRVFCHRG